MLDAASPESLALAISHFCENDELTTMALETLAQIKQLTDETEISLKFPYGGGYLVKSRDFLMIWEIWRCISIPDHHVVFWNLGNTLPDPKIFRALGIEDYKSVCISYPHVLAFHNGSTFENRFWAVNLQEIKEYYSVGYFTTNWKEFYKLDGTIDHVLNLHRRKVFLNIFR